MKTVLLDSGRRPDGKAEVIAKFRSLGIECAEVSYDNLRETLANADFATVLGGDGSVLAAAEAAREAGKPILCINHGTLGYMSQLEQSELALLERLKSGIEYEERMTADARVIHADGSETVFTALNEIVVSKGGVSRMITLSLLCDGNPVGAYRADGIIVCTPTGSTAYNLSAGGPIIDTRLDALTVCPVCSHSLSGQRPMVFSPHSKIEIIPVVRADCETVLTADGKDGLLLAEGDRVTVVRGNVPQKFVKLKDDMFYKVLKNKLSQ